MPFLVALAVFLLIYPSVSAISLWIFLRVLPSPNEVLNTLPFAYMIMGVPALLSALTHVAWRWRYRLFAVCVMSFCLAAKAGHYFGMARRAVDMALFGAFGVIAGAVCSLIAAALARLIAGRHTPPQNAG